MNRTTLRKFMMGGALVIGVASAGIGAARSSSSSAVHASSSQGPMAVAAWDVARLLSVGPPDTVVVTLDAPSHAMLDAVPAAVYGPTDEALVNGAPVARRIVLVGADPVRTDRVARRLMDAGRDVRVLDGGVQAWDKAMDDDPAAPAQFAPSADWDAYRYRLALRRRFGSKDTAPAAPVAAPLPASGGAAAAPKKREGC